MGSTSFDLGLYHSSNLASFCSPLLPSSPIPGIKHMCSSREGEWNLSAVAENVQWRHLLKWKYMKYRPRQPLCFRVTNEIESGTLWLGFIPSQQF